MAMLAPVVGLVSSGISAMGSISAGNAQAQAEERNAQNAQLLAAYQAKQYKFEGESELAGAQRTMEGTQQKLAYTQSKLIATAAASGAGATDPTVLNVSGQLQQQGTLAALTDLWNGQNARTGAENKANAAIYQGQIDAQNDLMKAAAARQAAQNSAFGSILSGFGGLAKGFSGYG